MTEVRSVQLAPYLRLVLAPNPGPMTLDGTNTWIVGDPTRAAPIVVDPGPRHEGHLQAVLAACGGRIADIVLTHRHLDHSEGAAELASAAGCGVRAADPALQIGPVALVDKAELRVAGARLTAYTTPGHTSDSCSLLLVADDGVTWLLTGDTVLGRGTTVIMHPDGDLGRYFDSLALLESLVLSRGVSAILPGHGPVVDSPAEWLAFYRQHRLARLEQVRAALRAGDTEAAQVVRRVYADVDRSVWPAAERSVAAQLDYLDHLPATSRTPHSRRTGGDHTVDA